MTLPLSNLRLRVALLLVLSLGAGFLECQTTPGLSSLGGSVQDPDGAAVAGAQVVLNRPDGSQVAHLVSDRSGTFQFRNVPPGRYVVDVQQTGFRETKVNVVAGDTSRTPLKIVLKIAGVEEQVTVAASDTSAQVNTEIGQNQNGNSVDRDALDRLPVFDQDYITTLSRFLDPDAIGTNGVTLVETESRRMGQASRHRQSRTSRSIRIHTLHSSPDLVGRVSRSPRLVGHPSSMDPQTFFTGTRSSTPEIRSQS
jgi:hypothetical protein